jgi:hypothetical protein
MNPHHRISALSGTSRGSRIFPCVLAAALLILTGCASPNVNPPQPRANTGYVDFYAVTTEPVCWDVSRFDEREQNFKRVFSQLKPPEGQILRLAFAPGAYRLRVTFLDLVVKEPVVVEVKVEDGKIAPVKITLTEDGTTSVQRRVQQARGPTYAGSYGRRAEFSNEDSPVFRLSAEAGQPLAYQLKARMPYAAPVKKE